MQTLAELINSFVKSVFADLELLRKWEDICNTLTSIDQPAQSDSYIIELDVELKDLSQINTQKAQGPDNIPNWLLRYFAPILSKPVCTIFRFERVSTTSMEND